MRSESEENERQASCTYGTKHVVRMIAKDGNLATYMSNLKQQWLLAMCKPMGKTSMDWREATTKCPDFEASKV
jgi:hypothetical protein